MSDVDVTDSHRHDDMHGDTPILSVKTVIQETRDETRLEMAFLLGLCRPELQAQKSLAASPVFDSKVTTYNSKYDLCKRLRTGL